MSQSIVKYLLILFSLCIPMMSAAQEYEYNYCFFDNSVMPGFYFFSQTASGGGSIINNVNGKLPLSEEVFHTPNNALELQYRNAGGGNWKAIIYHQDIRGMDYFKKPAFLSFWIFSPFESVSENELPQIQFMKRDSSLSTVFRIPPVKANKWHRVLIPLPIKEDVNATHPQNILAIVLSQQDDAESEMHTLFIDDIEFLPDVTAKTISLTPVIISARGYALHVDIVWDKITDSTLHLVKIYRSENGRDYHAVGIQQAYKNRYADFTGETGKNYSYRISFLTSDYEETGWSSPVIAATKPMNDDELMTMVQEASFRYYWEGAEPNSGLARENIPGRRNMIAIGASGFGIMAIIVGTERNFITREEAIARCNKILTFLENAETFHGAYPHFMDGLSGKVVPFFSRRDNGADLVETSFLLQGLLAARQYFSGKNDEEKGIRDKITNIWEKVEWNWFRRYPDSKFLYWHWSPDQEWVINHKLIGWNETMIVYLLAIASPTHPIPAEMYYSGWANQDDTGQKYRSRWGQTRDGSMYTNGNTYFGIKLDVGVSNGGPLFFTHYSYMGYDPHFISDNYTHYFVNNQHIAQINYRYCLANPKNYIGYGENAWGLTASDGPYGYSADEPVPWQDRGKLTPTGAISSFPYTPVESMKTLKNYYYHYGRFLWGEYGFKDAFNLTDNWCSEIYMGLNQAPMTVMIENYRTGLIWKLFMQDPEIREGLKKLVLTGKN